MASEKFHRGIRGVLFDWGDTLVRPPGLTTDAAGHFASVEAFFREDLPASCRSVDTGDPTTWATFRDNYEAVARDQIRETHRTGREHDFERRLARTVRATFPEIATPDQEELQHLAGRLGERIEAACRPVEDAGRVVPHLRRQMTVGVLSNYPHPPTVRNSLQRFGLLPHLDTLSISGTIGWAKPDQRAFAHAIEDMGLPPAQVLYVGDDLVNDMAGAKAAGMATAWLPRPGATGRSASIDLTLTGLADLVDVFACHSGKRGNDER